MLHVRDITWIEAPERPHPVAIKTFLRDKNPITQVAITRSAAKPQTFCLQIT